MIPTLRVQARDGVIEHPIRTSFRASDFEAIDHEYTPSYVYGNSPVGVALAVL
jgi:hypothetical protein